MCAEKKCKVYMKDNLRAPPWKLVLQWGRQLAMDTSEIKKVSDTLSLRHAIGKIIPLFFFSRNPPYKIYTFPGPDPGHLSNSRLWKKTTPAAFRSPFFAQGDIGVVPWIYFLFFYKDKKLFFLSSSQVSSIIKIKSMGRFSVLFKHSAKKFSPCLSKI